MHSERVEKAFISYACFFFHCEIYIVPHPNGTSLVTVYTESLNTKLPLDKGWFLLFWTNTRPIPSLLYCFHTLMWFRIAYGIYSVYDQCHFSFCRLISTNAHWLLIMIWLWYGEIKSVNRCCWSCCCVFDLCEICFFWINQIWQTWTKKIVVVFFWLVMVSIFDIFVGTYLSFAKNNNNKKISTNIVQGKKKHMKFI